MKCFLKVQTVFQIIIKLHFRILRKQCNWMNKATTKPAGQNLNEVRKSNKPVISEVSEFHDGCKTDL